MEYGVVLRWWLAYQALLLVGWPVARRVLGDAPDRGASLAMPAGLVLLTVPTLWVGQLAFGPWVVAGVAVAVAAASALLWRRDVRTGALGGWRREYVEVVAMFTVAFLFLVAVRAASRGVHPYGGEKFLDFGLLQSLLRAEYLPPEDMWFAGERVLYYYGGHLMAAVLATLTGTPGRYAYSPALAGFYAMAVTGAYGLASTATATADRASDRVRYGTAVGAGAVVLVVLGLVFGAPLWAVAVPVVGAVLAVTRSARVRAGVLASFAFGFASNLLTPVRLAASRIDVVREALVAAGMRPGREPTITPGAFDRWHASRVVENGINEFPLFAYLNGDLHAHMTSVTVLFLVVGVCLAYYRTPAGRRWRRRGLLFGALPVLVGTMVAVNTWSVPTTLGVTALTVALADAPARTLLPDRFADRLAGGGPGGREVRRIALGLAVAVAVGLLAVVVAWPFVWNVLLAGAGRRAPAAFPTTTRLGAFLLVHGVFLVAFGAYLVSRAAAAWTDWVAAALAAVALVTFGASFDLVLAGVRLDTLAVSLAGPLLLGAWLLRRHHEVGFEAVLVVAGAGLVVLVEYVYLNDNASAGRFNTIFKVYAQVWALWSVAGGVALASLASRPSDRGDESREALARVRSAGGTLLVVALVVSASVYGALALSEQFSDVDDGSIDAMQLAHERFPDQAAAIEWLADRPGQPHIVSAPGIEPYTWQSPASSLTGIPTVLGWVQTQIYHGEAAFEVRRMDVRVIYTTDDPLSRAALLRKHDVRYVWVGPVERNRYPIASMADEPGITRAFENDGVTVYAVNQSALVEQENSGSAALVEEQSAASPGAGDSVAGRANRVGELRPRGRPRASSR